MEEDTVTKFIVKVRKRIHSGYNSASSEDVCLEREVELPFTPFVGLHLVGTISDDDWWEEDIVQVIWDIKDYWFELYCENDKELFYAERNGLEKRDINEIAAEYTRLGWNVVEVYE